MADPTKKKTGMNDPETNLEAQTPPNAGPAETNPATGTAASSTEGARSTGEMKEEAKKLEKGYEDARRELDDVVGRLRSEVQRLHLEDSGAKTKAWIEQNPTVSLALALGGGVLAGRLLKKAFTPEPAPLSTRARAKAGLFATAAGAMAHDLGDAVSDQARVTSKRVSKARKNARKELRKRGNRLSKEAVKISGDVSKASVAAYLDLSARARKLSGDLAHYAGELSEDVEHRTELYGKALSKKATGIAKAASHAAGDASGMAHETGQQVSKSLKKQSKSLKKQAKKSDDYSDTLVTAFKTALAAVLVKRVNGLVRRIS